MAGTLQTGMLLNGHWTTTNVDIDTVLEFHKEKDQDDSQSEPEKPPVFGLLTQTVVCSPVIHWILTAQIRSPEHHDVILIGDRTVQISYFGSDGQLHGVGRKTDFNSRIRNVGIIGLSAVEHSITEDLTLDFGVKKDDEDVSMSDASAANLLPPQLLVLALESGELMFTFASNSTTGVNFITTGHKVARLMLAGESGAHLTFDPSSRYMAVGTCDTIGIYAIRSIEEMAVQHAQGAPLRPISSERYIPTGGLILHMKFLFPAPNDPDHVILLAIVAKNGSTAMLVYEWEAGQHLSTLKSNNIDGHKLHQRYRMPLLVVPLAIKSNFLLVFQFTILECTNILLGPPNYVEVPIKQLEASKDHLGLGRPLWVSWTRSPSLQSHQMTRDNIFLAREDGIILFIEIADQDSGGYIIDQVEAGNLGCHIGTAFARLELPNYDSDFLAVGGDSCNAGVYLISADGNPTKTDSIINWSPTMDFVTTAIQRDVDLSYDALESPTTDFVTNAAIRRDADLFCDVLESPKRRRLAVEPDKIYACTGRGAQGAISEIRYGYEACLRFDAPGLGFTARESWVLPVDLEDPACSPSNLFSSSSLFLMSAGGMSVLLRITADSSEIEDVNQERTWLDLDSRTLAAIACSGIYVQITERSILASTHSPYSESTPATCYKEQTHGRVIVAAEVYQAEFVMAVTQDEDSNFQAYGLRLRHDSATDILNLDSSHGSLITFEPLTGSFYLSGYPISISIIRQSDESIYAIICTGSRNKSQNLGSIPAVNNSLQLAIFEIRNGRELVKVEPETCNWPLFDCGLSRTLLDAYVDIAHLRGIEGDSSYPELVLEGYRSGLLIMRQYIKGGILECRVLRYTLGSTAVSFRIDPAVPNVAIVYCDSKLWRVTYDSYSHANPALHRIWFTTAEDPLHNQPAIDTVSLSSHQLLLTSGKRLLIASLDSAAKLIPRSMPVRGAANRVLYSHSMSKLIVALTEGNRSSLTLLDPESGKLFNNHYNSAGGTSRFPPGLGNPDERILSLVEWRCEISGMAPEVLLVGTNQGRLLIYSVVFSDFSRLNLGENDLRWTMYVKERYSAPVSAIATCKNTLVVCIGLMVRWVSLDVTKRRLIIRAEYVLPSRGVSVTVDGHWISVLTAKHSLIKLLLVDKKQHPTLSEHHGKLFPQFGDESARDGLDQIPLPSESIGNDSALVMLADADCSVAGLWCSKKAHGIAADYETIFEAELRSSVVKFRTGRVRPPWDTISGDGGLTVPSHPAGELLGIGVDGSITHFAFLTEHVWRLLKFLQELIYLQHSPSRTESNNRFWEEVVDPRTRFRDEIDPRTRHIDGEILRSLLGLDKLEMLLELAGSLIKDEDVNWAIAEFCHLCQAVQVEGGIQPEHSIEVCFEKAYRLMADLLRPVI